MLKKLQDIATGLRGAGGTISLSNEALCFMVEKGFKTSLVPDKTTTYKIDTKEFVEFVDNIQESKAPPKSPREKQPKPKPTRKRATK